MITIEQKFNALAAYVLAEDETTRHTARRALVAAVRAKTAPEIASISTQEDIVHQYLMELGADASLMGYKYLVFAILRVAQEPSLVDNITKDLYPMVAIEFDTTATRAERSIRHTIERIWDCGDYQTLTSLGYVISTVHGKPTNGNFLARSALNIRSRLKK
jgi:two-component system response regulator (stage 0 sporulation protein A)